MSDTNIYISNGTCYSASEEKLDESFIPCGNDAFGHQTCCGAGDNCLADNSCFGFHGSGYGSYLTYMAGCSDPDYEDSSCPQKDIDQPWIALTLCDDSDGAWAACSQSGDPTTLRPGSYCSCTDAASATVQFRDSTSLTSICSLPSSTGQSIKYFAGHTPTSSASSGSSASASSSGTTGSSATATQTRSTTVSASGTGAGITSGKTSAQTGLTTDSLGSTIAESSGGATSSQTGSNPSSSGGTTAGNSGTTSSSQTGTALSDGGTGSGLSSGTKIGIGVGAGVGGLILLAAIVALFFCCRKPRRSRSEIETGSADGTEPSKHDSSDHQRAAAMSTTPRVWGADEQTMAAADGGFAWPWGQRVELEGRQVVPKRAELAGGSAVTGNAREGQMRHGDVNPVAELPGSMT